MKLVGSASQRAKAARQCCQPARGSLRQASDVSKLVSHCLWAELLADALRIPEKCPEAVSAPAVPVYGTSSIRLAAARSCPVSGRVCIAAAPPTSRRTQPHCPRQGLPSNTVCVVTVLAALP